MRWGVFIPLLLLVIFAASSTTLAQWTQTNGPDGGPVYAITSSGSNILAGGDYGLFLSIDNGATWQQVLSDETLIRINAFAKISAYLFAGTWDKGVIFSWDNGVTWSTTSLCSTIVRALVSSGNTLYAGTHSGVYRTTDFGLTWEKTNQYFTTSMVVLGTKIFAGTNNGVFCSTDNGNNWSEVSNGLTNKNILALAASGTVLYAGTSGLFCSSDSGANWSVVSNDLTKKWYKHYSYQKDISLPEQMVVFLFLMIMEIIG